jgi:AraC-like DNA-binding protein
MSVHMRTLSHFILSILGPRRSSWLGDFVLYLVGMRVQSRRAELAMRREIRLCDAITFARLCRARDYLGASYCDRITLEDAARQACLSPFHFNRLFAQAFGETPHEFVTRMRIEAAKKLLLAENRSVTDICFDVGYQSLGSFSLRFRSLTGLSPVAFRREARSTFGGFAARWPLYYIPACYQRFFLGPL